MAVYALPGRVVTMDRQDRVLPDGVVYVEAGRIIAVEPSGGPPPPGIVPGVSIETGGTIYPGLIELHNHLSYDLLPPWEVSKQYANRDQWAGSQPYADLVTGPMRVLARIPGLLAAIVRYVETKCLFSGVTSSQGIALFSGPGIRRFYRGLVRNVEETGEPDLPEAATRIADVEARDGEKFRERLEKSTCLLLHLSEGLDQKAREHFLALQSPSGSWAIRPALAGIHCTGLAPRDFGVMKAHGGKMIWSPFSNFTLYGQTAAIAAAADAGLSMGLGGDWSVTGSRNLLAELKVARLASRMAGGVLDDRRLVSMATREAAAILGWEDALGSLGPGRRADLIVVEGDGGDPWAQLVEAVETDLALVMIDGIPRYGRPEIMAACGLGAEDWSIGGRPMVLNLADTGADPLVEGLTLRAARDQLAEALADLPELARAASGVQPLPEPGTWRLLLDEDDPGEVSRPELPYARRKGLTGLPALSAAEPLQIRSMALDPLTVVDDQDFPGRLARAVNLPAAIKEGLPGFY